jgi:hypothetical protein
MKFLARALLVLGVASMVFALGSCVQYYAVNPPPEASLPGWDAETQAGPYIRLTVFWVALGAGFYTFRLGRYLHGRTSHKQQET